MRPLCCVAGLMLVGSHLAAGSGFAQEPPTLEFGSVVRMRSAALGEERRLNVLLPAGYAGSDDRYPVVYLLDGSAHEDYFHAASLFDFLATYGVMPPTIVVGVSNVDRRRDFTLPSSDPEDVASAPTSGGAARFVRFLADELVPFVNARYRTSGVSTLVGQSLAGLLATQVLVERPATFTNYVIVSPSLWWDRQALLTRAATALEPGHGAGRRVYLSVGDEGEAMLQADQQLAGLIRAAGMECRFDRLTDETHATSLHISLYHAMRWLHRPAGK